MQPIQPSQGVRRPVIEGAGLNASRRRLAQFFLAHHALSAVDAAYFKPVTQADARVFAAMRKAGIVREASPHHYYIDLARYDAIIVAEQRRGVWVAGFGALILVALLTLLYQG